MLGEVLSGLNVLDRIVKFWDWLRAKRHPPAETLGARFVRLFECHGVHRNQIPRFINHGLSIKDVQDDAALLGILDESILEAACERFAVRREWLDGAEERVYLLHDFYKRPEEFSGFLDQLRRDNPDREIIGVLLIPEESNSEANALLILQETIGFIGDKAICRYHICDNWRFSYWKARAYLTACVAAAWRRRVYIHGARMLANELQELGEGHVLVGSKGGDIWGLSRKSWDPEQMALDPAAYLDGIDPEQDDYGIKSGLKLWLELARRGLMDAGSGASAVERFEHELAKY